MEMVTGLLLTEDRRIPEIVGGSAWYKNKNTGQYKQFCQGCAAEYSAGAEWEYIGRQLPAEVKLDENGFNTNVIANSPPENIIKAIFIGGIAILILYGLTKKAHR